MFRGCISFPLLITSSVDRHVAGILCFFVLKYSKNDIKRSRNPLEKPAKERELFREERTTQLR